MDISVATLAARFLTFSGKFSSFEVTYIICQSSDIDLMCFFFFEDFGRSSLWQQRMHEG